ncbi:MAG: hypothetical protein ACI4MT_05890 [Christensenellales bacterium]
MRETLEKVISNNNNGLFLLDPPTGFGKTTEVVDLIRRFLNGDPLFYNVKRIFFVTNLITNLPYQDLLNSLDNEHKKLCFQAKATIDYVLENFFKANVTESEVKNSKEYKTLKKEIETYYSTKKAVDDAPENSGLKNSLNILKQKIATDSEPTFRQFIKSRFFYNKSIIDREKFMRENRWFIDLYPICNIEDYKVIFLTTQKFISPIDTFRRVPFYAYNDKITDRAIVFIDEYDSSKTVVLDQIIEDGLKNRIDIVSLFLDLHFALQNFTIPQKLLQISEYHKKKVESGDWPETQWIFNTWREKFRKKYEEHNVNYLIKSVDFKYDKAFLFDDGKYFNIVKDSSKKFIYADVDSKEDILSLRGMEYSGDYKPINNIIFDLEYCIDEFTKTLYYVYNNYLFYKNENKKPNEIKYTEEEAIYTVLDALNLNEDKKEYLFNKIQKGDYIFEKIGKDSLMRKGFNFIEIEDSNYHDMKSVVRNYSFPTTPEDVILKLAGRSLVVGISATAKVDTCIGNYDKNYLESKLNNKFITSTKEDEERVAAEFNRLINDLSGQYQIHTNIIDDFNVFSDKEKCLLFINELYEGNLKEKYIAILEDERTKSYYFLIELKLAYLYKQVCENEIYSFIAFENRFPKSGEDFDLDRLIKLFDDLCEQNGYSKIVFEIINSQDFDEKLNKVKGDLAQGKKVFVLTTYQTVGSGKNVQYAIPEMLERTVIRAGNDTKGTKDFEAIYLATPTNMLQVLRGESENIYADLAKYLFHQEYLFQNKHISYAHMKYNIANGFRKAFFGENNSFYPKNGDLNAHTLKIIIQAIGRICRCRNKNKNIYIFSDKEVVERIQRIKNSKLPKLLNEEFRALLKTNVSSAINVDRIQEYSRQSKNAFYDIRGKAWTIRNSKQAVLEWQEIRDFVLKNPTTDNPGKFKWLYFEFDDKCKGYSYSHDAKFNIVDMRIDTIYNMNQVSEQACDLPIILSIKSIEEMFNKNGYATKFKRARYVLNPSAFKQVYLGALGEVVGKYILEEQLGWDLKELDDYSKYELFDYKLNNLYFDFKHWDKFIVDNDKYVSKVQMKLSKVKGDKAIVVNLIKRTNATIKDSIDESVVQIPYLIDPYSGCINEHIEDLIGEFC